MVTFLLQLKRFSLFTFSLLVVIPLWGQQFQGFENSSSDTWNFSSTPDPYNEAAGSDVWKDTTVTENIQPASGERFWHMRDLDNPNGGIPGFHILEFETIDVSASSFNTITFKYYTIGFENSDSIGYMLRTDNGTAWDNADYVDLSRSTNAWETVVIQVPGDAQFVRFRLMAKQNGNTDFGGFDDVELVTESEDMIAPLVTDADVIDESTIQITFNEGMNEELITNTANYVGIPNIASINYDLPQVTINLGTPLNTGQAYTLTISGVTDLAGNPLAEPFEFSFTYNNSTPELIITEIMYNHPGEDSLEFVELINAGTENAVLGGLEFEGSFNFTFPELTLEPGEIILLALNAADASAFYGQSFLDWGESPLPNGGGVIQLLNFSGTVIDEVNYTDTDPWPSEADGDGPSMELIDFELNNNLGASWQPSSAPIENTNIFATPGTYMLVNTEEITSLETFTVFPNPATDWINLQVELSKAENLEMQLVSVTGQVLESDQLSLLEGVYVQRLDIRAYPAGFYYVSLKSENDIQTIPLIIR